MSATAKQFAKKALNYALPVGGFAVGWVAFTLAEDNNWISQNAQRKMNIANLKLQLCAQRYLPASVTEKYGYPEKVLLSMIDSMEKGYSEEAMNDRVTFDEILSECELPEQIGFLEEHASEEIPYFYIADVFHSWARLHEGTFLHAERRERRQTEKPLSPKGQMAAGPLLLRDIPELDSEVLCKSLWEKMLNRVIPYDVSIRALCVLAVNNKANAKRLASAADVNALIACYEAYEKKESERPSNEDSVIDHAEVYAATLFFLCAINDAAVRKRWFPGFGQPRTGPFPLATRVDADRWCSAFSPSKATRMDLELVAEPASLFADMMCEKLRCNERAVPLD